METVGHKAGRNISMEAVSHKAGRNISIASLIVIFLILLFFAIPVCSLAICDKVTSWPKMPVSFIYNVFSK